MTKTKKIKIRYQDVTIYCHDESPLMGDGEKKVKVELSGEEDQEVKWSGDENSLEKLISCVQDIAQGKTHEFSVGFMRSSIGYRASINEALLFTGIWEHQPIC